MIVKVTDINGPVQAKVHVEQLGQYNQDLVTDKETGQTPVFPVNTREKNNLIITINSKYHLTYAGAHPPTLGQINIFLQQNPDIPIQKKKNWFQKLFNL